MPVVNTSSWHMDAHYFLSAAAPLTSASIMILRQIECRLPSQLANYCTRLDCGKLWRYSFLNGFVNPLQSGAPFRHEQLALLQMTTTGLQISYGVTHAGEVIDIIDTKYS